MQDAIYSAMFGAMSNEFRVNQIANNLANVNTTGYKQDNLAFHDTFLRFAHDYAVNVKTHLRGEDVFPKEHIMAKPRLADQQVDFSQGNMSPTGNTLDLAIHGDGFFQVRTPEGDFLTRNGRFQISPEGQLVTEQGYQVLGEGGPIEIPGAGNLVIGQGGVIRQNQEEVGQIGLYTVEDLGSLEKIGSNLFGSSDGEPNVIPAAEASINQGYLERSNVEVVTEMVKMIESQRSHQAYMKILKGTDRIDRRLITRVGRVI